MRETEDDVTCQCDHLTSFSILLVLVYAHICLPEFVQCMLDTARIHNIENYMLCYPKHLSRYTVEPLLKDSLNKGHHINYVYLHTKDTF